MSIDNRGSITQQGNFLRLDNALVEEVFAPNRSTGFLLVSYAVPRANGMTSIELLRLNVNRNTVVMDASGSRMCLCDIRKGMWINALFSSITTRSNPPQSNAFLIVARRAQQPSTSVTTDRVASVDPANNFLITGNPNNINSQMRFVITNATVITDRNGYPIRLRALRPGQLVRVTHSNVQTASIPPQSTAFRVQVL